jgi:CRISPR/Cas system CSM-associated protein Csm3 (group 7 of RAMP superfamily)
MTALLLAALNSLMMLGGNRSRGLGWVRIEASAEPGLKDFDMKEELQTWLKTPFR